MIISLSIATGCGALVRYLITNLGKKINHGLFPWQTLFLNLTGSFALAFLWGIHANTVWSTVLGTGFLGGYTTFSTFNTEVFALFHEKHWRQALIYLVLSYLGGLILGVIGIIIGLKLR